MRERHHAWSRGCEASADLADLIEKSRPPISVIWRWALSAQGIKESRQDLGEARRRPNRDVMVDIRSHVRRALSIRAAGKAVTRPMLAAHELHVTASAIGELVKARERPARSGAFDLDPSGGKDGDLVRQLRRPECRSYAMK